MSDPASIDDRIVAAVNKAEDGARIYHAVANGPVGGYTPTESGPIPSILEWQNINAAALGGIPAINIRLGELEAKSAKFTVAVSDMKSLMALGTYVESTIYDMASWHIMAGVSERRGGGRFIWLPTVPKIAHEGGNWLSPTVPYDGSYDGVPGFLAGAGETNPAGTGVLMRISDGDVFAEQYGLIGVPTYSMNCKSFQAAINFAKATSSDIWPKKVRFMDGDYRTSDPIVLHMPEGLTGRLPGFRGNGVYNSRILKTTANKVGLAYGAEYDLDVALIEIPRSSGDPYLGGSDTGDFVLEKLSQDYTGRGYYAKSSIFGKRSNMVIRYFDKPYETDDCWMSSQNHIWCLSNNYGPRILGGTSNTGHNLYSDGARLGGFSFRGLTYSEFSALACDGTGSQETDSTIAYDFELAKGVSVSCGVERHVGVAFNFSNSDGILIKSGRCYHAAPVATPTKMIVCNSSTVRFASFDFSLAVENLSAGDKANYSFASKNTLASVSFGAVSFSPDLGPEFPRQLDGKFCGSVSLEAYSHINGITTHTIDMNNTVWKKAVFVGKTSRFKLTFASTIDKAIDFAYEPMTAIGHAVNSVSTDPATPTDVGILYSSGVAGAARLQGYVDATGWLNVRPSNAGNNRTYHTIWHSAPLL